eukprot:GEMP01086639.1.p1 GENE.GEMP01086639.1~~GEMP01086639.1.p1  ORF type:complete len:156 (+),score=36.09 GEMP01086639.1:75-542(+)
MSKWAIKLDNKMNLPDPIGFKVVPEDPVDKRRKTAENKALMERKAWETASSPIQSVGMNIFMLWMSGSSPGIFSVLIVTYCISSIATQFRNCNVAFQHFSVDTTLQKLCYIGLCLVSMGYVLWHASGMGLLPTSSGDWVHKIAFARVSEHAEGSM